MQSRNYGLGEFCLANCDIAGSKGDILFTEGMSVQIMAYDPGKVDTPHSIRGVGDMDSGILRVWVSESQLRKDLSKPNQRLPGTAP